MTPADTYLNKMTRSAVTVAKEPDARYNSRVLDIRLELGADFDVGHGFWETPEVLRREVVPVVWRPFAGCFCNPNISDSYYVMSSRHVRVELSTDKCSLRQSSELFSRTSLSYSNIKVLNMSAKEVRL